MAAVNLLVAQMQLFQQGMAQRDDQAQQMAAELRRIAAHLATSGATRADLDSDEDLQMDDSGLQTRAGAVSGQPSRKRRCEETPTPPGIVNLGNTCYLAATIQFLAAGRHGYVPPNQLHVGTPTFGRAAITLLQKATVEGTGASPLYPLQLLSFLMAESQIFAQVGKQDAE